MAERRSVIEMPPDDEDLRGQLTAISTLLFASTSDRAPRMNAALRPVREAARAASREPARDMVAALDECWRLLDRAAVVIDGEPGRWLRPGTTTREWAEGRVALLSRPCRPSS